MRICASKLIEHSRKIELPSQHARHPDALLEPPPLILLSRSEKSSLDSSCVKQQCTQSISELTTHSSQMAHAIRKRNRKSEPEGQMARSSRSIGPAMLSAARRCHRPPLVLVGVSAYSMCLWPVECTCGWTTCGHQYNEHKQVGAGLYSAGAYVWSRRALKTA